MRAWRLQLDARHSRSATGRSRKPSSLPLPDKPSIAVLPFQNMSGDPEQEYFADGMVEDIITELSRIRWLFVIARNSTFTYKGQAVDVKQVARELGVRYVLEGSVRKGGNRVRVTAQLIDAASGAHIWAERYDRDLSDIFAVQDEITASVAGVIEPALAEAEQQRVLRKPPERLDAWEAYQRGLWHFNRYRTGGEQNRVSLLSPSYRARSEFRSRPLRICAGPAMGDLALLDAPLLGGSRSCRLRKRALRFRSTTRMRWRMPCWHT